MKSNLLALVCAILGGAVGFIICSWLLGQNLYGLAIPGGLLGFSAGMVRNKSIFVAILCGLMATVLGFYTEWHHHPFIADQSLKFFLTHLNELKPITLIMIAIGGFIGFWVPFRSRVPMVRTTQPSADSN